MKKHFAYRYNQSIILMSKRYPFLFWFQSNSLKIWNLYFFEIFFVTCTYSHSAIMFCSNRIYAFRIWQIPNSPFQGYSCNSPSNNRLQNKINLEHILHN